MCQICFILVIASSANNTESSSLMRDHATKWTFVWAVKSSIGITNHKKDTILFLFCSADNRRNLCRISHGRRLFDGNGLEIWSIGIKVLPPSRKTFSKPVVSHSQSGWWSSKKLRRPCGSLATREEFYKCVFPTSYGSLLSHFMYCSSCSLTLL